MSTTVEHVAAIRELSNVFADHDMMTVAQETFAEQARETLHYAAEALVNLDAEVARLVDVIRLCRPYIWSDAHSEEADWDCDNLMDIVLRDYGMRMSDG